MVPNANHLDLDFEGAERAVGGVARRTPLLPADDLSQRLGVEVLIKAECLQVTGSFKVRGAAARLAALTSDERTRGVVACSSGNHGRAVAHVAEQLGIPATIYVPQWVDPVKLEGIRAAGAEAVLAGSTFDEAEVLAVRYAEESTRPYVSAYDDPWVIAGQGTIALEILDQIGRPPGALLAPLSGGGLIGGIAGAFRARLGIDAPPCVGVSASRAAVMRASVEAGRPIDLPEEETLASALAGGIGLQNRYSFPLIRDLVEEHPLVEESDIAEAMRYSVRQLHLVTEGGGAVALAALLADRWRPSQALEAPVVVVLSGGNVSEEILRSVLDGHSGPGDTTLVRP